MIDKKALALLKKYYLPYQVKGEPSAEEMKKGIDAGVLVPVSKMSHDEITAEIRLLSSCISLEAAAKGFLYSLSSRDLRYRTALSSLVWARALPDHPMKKTERRGVGVCSVCGCTHGLAGSEKVDWNEYGVFRYLPPIQYGKDPDFTCAEYVLNDLREFEKLPAVEPCEEDYRILNGIFAAAGLMKPHNMDTALASEIRRLRLLEATGNGIHCLLAVLSICGVLEGAEHKGFLHTFTNSGITGNYRDGLSFYPLFFWRGKDGINYDAVEELFGSFSGGKLTPDKAALPQKKGEVSPKKAHSSAEQCFTEGVYSVMLTNEERRYLALNDLQPEWEKVTLFSSTYTRKKRTVLFYQGNTIVKVIYEQQDVKGTELVTQYNEYDTCLATDDRKLLLPLTSRGRAKPVTSANVMAIVPFGCKVTISLRPGESTIWAYNARNCQEIAIGEEDRIQNILTDEGFHRFMQYYMATCPDDYFDRIAEVREMEHQTVTFGAGDIFRCQVDRTHYTYGLILGKTREIEKWKELPKIHTFRDLMAQPLLVRLYDFVTTDAHMTAEQLSQEPLRSPEIYTDEDIIWGTHKIVAHKELEPDDILFQIHLARQSGKRDPRNPFLTENQGFLVQDIFHKELVMTSLYVEWGFASVEIPWADVPEDIRQMVKGGNYFQNGVSLRITGAYCGKTLADILQETSKHRMQYDLLLPENRDDFNRVMECLGMPKDCTYDEFAAKYGGLSRREYIERLKTRSR